MRFGKPAAEGGIGGNACEIQVEHADARGGENAFGGACGLVRAMDGETIGGYRGSDAAECDGVLPQVGGDALCGVVVRVGSFEVAGERRARSGPPSISGALPEIAEGFDVDEALAYGYRTDGSGGFPSGVAEGDDRGIACVLPADGVARGGDLLIWHDIEGHVVDPHAAS